MSEIRKNKHWVVLIINDYELHDSLECEINKRGQIRQKSIMLGGQKFTDFIRKPTEDKRGNLYLPFKDINGQQFNKFVHRLVAETYIPNPENKLYVAFKDGNRQNCKSSNLFWTNKRLADNS